MTKTDVCNLALGHLGQWQLSTSNVDTENTPQAIHCRAVYDNCLRALQRRHRWNFLRTQERLEAAWAALAGAAISDDGEGVAQVEHEDHGLASGDRVTIRDVMGCEGINGSWFVTVVDEDHFTLDGSEFESGYADDTGEWVQAPLFDWGFQLALPADMLRLWEVDGADWHPDRQDFEIAAGGLLLADRDRVNIVYGALAAAPEAWDQLFLRAFTLCLAVELCPRIVNDDGKKRGLYEQYMMALADAGFTDAVETRPRVVPPTAGSNVLDARAGGAGWRE